MKLVAENLCVNRGIRRIVQDVCFVLDDGDTLTVTGENGSGKSTLLQAMAGLLRFAEGTLRLEGIANGMPLREACHYLGHQNGMKNALTVQENLSFWQEFSGMQDSEAKMPVGEALELVGMQHTLNLPFGYLSTGMKRRVAIARLLINDRPVWIVDEPTSGLDAESTQMFASLCKDFCNDGGILVAATHLPLGLGQTKSLHLEKLYTFFEGEEFYEATE